MLKILQYPHPLLRRTATAISVIDTSINQLVTDMLATIHASQSEPDGVGLAATQVGIPKRLFIMQLPNGKIEAIINPLVLRSSKRTLISLPKEKQLLEGCLSFPGYYGFVNRPQKIKVSFQTLKGLEKQTVFLPPFSTYFQHELDHLNGVVFIDHLKQSSQQLYLVDKKTAKLKPVKNPF